MKDLPTRPEQYPELLSSIKQLVQAEQDAALRWLCRHDQYYLQRYILGWEGAEHPWLFARCREVQAGPDGYLDLWAREHGKTSLLTIGMSIQDILRTHGDEAEGEEVTIGIFSHTRPISKSFLSKIKREFEGNQALKHLFPDVLFENPKAQSPRWSLDDGIIVKRKTNPPEATIEAHGLVDGQPTGKHFDLLVFDDVVTLTSVTTPEQIQKTTEALAISYNLGKMGTGKRRMIGTRYHYNDSYREVLERGTFKPRLYPATEDGTVDGNPVLLTREELADKYRDQGPYVFSCQQLLNPVAAGNQGFQEIWLRYWQPKNWRNLNRYIVVDPAHSKKKGSDFTVIWVIGLGADQNYYLIDGIRDRLNLMERTQALFDLHRKYRPLTVGYERYGMQADIQHIEEKQNQYNYRFKVTELGGAMPKYDRIKMLVPLFAMHRFYLPVALNKVTTEGEVRDIVRDFVRQEFLPFPVPVYDDGLDCMARILDDDLKAMFPSPDWEKGMGEPEAEEVY